MSHLTALAATFTDGVMIPEYLFIAFQMTFAAITPALIVGAFAERIKFSALMVFVLLWVTIVYFPIAHMVWDANGLIFNMGAIDFAGGTVVHINAGIAALCGSIMIGKRVGLGRDNMAPHSMTLTMVGAAMLWVGWFGFNAGSNLEATSGATLAMINTFTATAGGILGLVRDRSADPRQSLYAGCRIRHGRGPCRRDARLRHHRPGGCDCAGRDCLGRVLLLCGRGQEQGRL